MPDDRIRDFARNWAPEMRRTPNGYMKARAETLDTVQQALPSWWYLREHRYSKPCRAVCILLRRCHVCRGCRCSSGWTRSVVQPPAPPPPAAQTPLKTQVLDGCLASCSLLCKLLR